MYYVCIGKIAILDNDLVNELFAVRIIAVRITLSDPGLISVTQQEERYQILLLSLGRLVLVSLQLISLVGLLFKSLLQRVQVFLTLLAKNAV